MEEHMKDNKKNMYDEFTVDEIPEGKENEYYSEEQSLEIKNKLKSFARFQIVFIMYFVILIIISILKMFVEFPDWLRITIYVIAGSGVITIIIGIFKYTRLLKFIKDISEN